MCCIWSTQFTSLEMKKHWFCFWDASGFPFKIPLMEMECLYIIIKKLRDGKSILNRIGKPGNVYKRTGSPNNEQSKRVNSVVCFTWVSLPSPRYPWVIRFSSLKRITLGYRRCPSVNKKIQIRNFLKHHKS